MTEQINMAALRDATFQMRTTKDFLDRIDEWRLKQRPPISRAQAIHVLAERQMEAEAKEGK
jgi:hypothetical protein